LDEIRQKLEQIKALCWQREAQGYDPFDPEFLYRYLHLGSPDQGSAEKCACTDCLPRIGEEYRGNVVVSACPQCIQMSEQAWDVNEHERCHCSLELENGAEACCKLLTDEIQEYV